MNNFSASRETDYGQQFEIKHKFASNNSDEGFDEDFDGEDDFEESKGSVKPGKKSDVDEKVDPYDYFQKKFGIQTSQKNEDYDVSEMSLDEDKAKVGDDKFEDDSEEDYNDIDHYEQSHQSDQKKFQVNVEQNKNVFKDKALVSTIKNEAPVGKKETKYGQEFEIKNNVKEESQGFDDDIEESGFPEESIHSEMDNSQKGNPFNEQTRVNMASVVPNPKIIKFEDTHQVEATRFTYPEVQFQDIEEEDEMKEHSNKKKKRDDSYDIIAQKINQIQPKWSPKNSQVNSAKKQAQLPEIIKKPQVNPKASLQKKTDKQSSIPAKAPPIQSKAHGRPQSGVRRPKPDNTNKDLGEVMPNTTQEERKTISSKPKSQRIVFAAQRPESAKPPKSGYSGQPNVLGTKSSKNSQQTLNPDDLSTQVAQSKKFQMIKKLKEEKERKKEMVVRDLQKAKVLQQKQKDARKASLKNPPPIEQHNDDDNFFQEAEEIKGDQGLFDFFKSEKNDELQERQSVKDLKVQKDQQKTSTKETGWVGNALGSGGFNQQPNLIARDNVNMALDKQKKDKPVPPQVQQKESGWNVSTAAKNQPDPQELQKQEEAKAKFQELMREKKDKQNAGQKDVLAYIMQQQLKLKENQKTQQEQNINKLVKDFDTNGKKQEVNKGSDKVPEFAKTVVDDEAQNKILQDLKRRLKEIHYENKQIKVNIQTVERNKRVKEIDLEKVMQSKKLVYVNGKLECQPDLSQVQTQNKFRLEDLPDYKSMKEERENPMQSVVKKIESTGYTLEQIFVLFDDNGDQLLTIKEVQEGLQAQEVQLTDLEMKELVKAIDANSDGVLTLEEWINTLNPKLQVEQEYNEILSGLDIDDPIDLEEKILDLKFKLRRLNGELDVLREQKALQYGFSLKDKEEKSTTKFTQQELATKIKDLESQLNHKKELDLLEQQKLEEKIKNGLIQKEQVNEEFERYQKLKQQQDQAFSIQNQTVQSNITELEQKLNKTSQICLMLIKEKEDKKQQITRLELQCNSFKKVEEKLDSQLEQLLGRAIDGKDFELLKTLNLKTLNQIKSNNADFNKHVQNLVIYSNFILQGATKIQSYFRSFYQRNKFKLMKFSVKRLARLLKTHYIQPVKNMKTMAAIRIQRMFRRKREKKEQLMRLKLKYQERRLKEEEDEKFQKSQEELQDAARKIWARWKSYKNKKKADIYGIAKLKHATTFNRTIGVVYMPSIRKCSICRGHHAQRLCPSCQEAIYCDNCFGEYHMSGYRRMHNYKRIRFGDKPEGGENEQPNQQKKSSMKAPETQEAKKSVKFLEEEGKIGTEDDFIYKVVAPKKKEKLFGVDYLKSLKGRLDFDEMMGFAIAEDEDSIRLADLREGLMGYQKEFKMDEDEIDKLCEITEELCKCPSPVFDEEDEDAVLISWVTLVIILLCMSYQSSMQKEEGAFAVLSQALDYQYQKFKLLANPKQVIEALTEVYDMMSGSESYKRKLRERHEKDGLLRSAEGTTAEIMQRRYDQQQREELEQLYKSRVPVEPKYQSKVYKLYLEEFKKNFSSNSSSLYPDHKIILKQTPPLFQNNVKDRMLSFAQNQEIEISEVRERYPQGVCYNGGQLSSIEQIYYMCTQITTNKTIRVTEQTFQLLSRDYPDQYRCGVNYMTNKVCVCPQGYYSYDCSLQLYTKCFVNITSPPFYKGCSERPDTPEYMYSIPGYDPCFPLDFSKVQKIGFMLTCKQLDESGLVNATGENMGYNYQDIVKAPTIQNFNYLSENPLTRYRIMKANPVKVAFDLRDWKWLSQKSRFEVLINDPLVLVGLGEQFVDVNFTVIEESDGNGLSRYVVGGRTYFEANAIGDNIQSFTTKGFFDKLGYVEPRGTKQKNEALIIGLSVGGAVLLTLIIVLACYCKKKQKKIKSEHID